MTAVRIVSEPLGGSSLAQRLQRGGAPAWLAPLPASADAWRSRARARAASADWRTRWQALLPAISPTGAAHERLERVMREGGVVITTGQQPGLFGGPIYTWSKAASALAFADALERHTGVPAAALYWAATDDADFAEASSTAVARAGGVDVVRSTNAPPPGTPMALAPLGDLQPQLAALRAACGSAPDPRALEAVERAYGDPSRTVGDAFVQLLRALLEPLGMPVLDASHAAVRGASADVLARALARAPAIASALAARGAEIDAAGERPQVDHVEGLSLVFVREGGTKRRLPLSEAGRVDASAWLTPNVLLRPVVEQAILPTVAYVAGPGELAYFAQVSAVAGAMEMDAPVAVPRWSCTLIEPDIQRLLDRFAATPGDLAAPDLLEGRVARDALAAEAAAALASLRSQVAALPAVIAGESSRLGLGGAVEGAMRAVQHRLDRLERRLVAGVKRHETGLMRDLATLRAALQPGGRRQERTLNMVPLLTRHGLELLAEMRDAAAAHASSVVERGSPS